jgi:hypothetical protein
VRPGALKAYDGFFESLGPNWTRSVVSSSVEVIDPEGKVTGRLGPDPLLWREGDRSHTLEDGSAVYRVAGHELLRRCVTTMRNPFNFLATAYPRELYRRVEGYGGSRLISPDKWFHWRLLAVAESAYFIDRPGFAYRWHPANQSAQQAASGALKHTADDYANVLELDGGILSALGMSRDDVEKAFVEYSVARHGLATLARGQRARAKRILRFGQAAFPVLTRRNRKILALVGLLVAGPLGSETAKLLYHRYTNSDG